MFHLPEKDLKYSKAQPTTIASLFDSIASHYDSANAYMSLGIFKYWNKRCISWLAGATPKTFGDLCGGTGEMTYLLLKQIPIDRGYIIDFSRGMLGIAKKRMKGHSEIKMLQSDVCSIALPDHLLDAAVIAYGIRNVKERECALREAYRLIRPGGSFAILELTRPGNPLLRLFHSLYLRTLVPLIGRLSTKNRAAYTYLSKSIHSFIEPKILTEEIKRAGFNEVEVLPLSFGAATLFTMRR